MAGTNEQGAPCYLLIRTTASEAEALARKIAQLGVEVERSDQAPAISGAPRADLYDTLTGLPTQRALIAFFQLHVANSQLFHALIYAHLERLQAINDSQGRHAGDQVICQAAERLQQLVGPEGGLARCSGNEFALLVPVIGPYQGAASVAQRLVELLQLPYRVHGRPSRVQCRVGIALYPEDASDAEQLIQYANKAAQHHSTSDEVYTFYRREMSDRITRRMALESALWQAVSQNELQVYYQPKVVLATGQWAGVEALLRWPRPEAEYISPDEFVPLLEDSGLINTVGVYVLEQACRDYNHWIELGLHPIPIAVNLATTQLRNHGLADIVRHTLNNFAMPPGSIELEITESGVMADPEHALVIFNYLRECGVQLTIDDFGTGYSSLSYLQRLPVHHLKIDQSFVRGIPDDAPNSALVEAVLSMCEALDIQVIAEGVETREQANFLLSRGCHYGQGYLFGKAMPANVLAGLLARSQEPDGLRHL